MDINQRDEKPLVNQQDVKPVVNQQDVKPLENRDEKPLNRRDEQPFENQCFDGVNSYKNNDEVQDVTDFQVLSFLPSLTNTKKPQKRKTVQCPACYRTMLSSNLKRHMRRRHLKDTMIEFQFNSYITGHYHYQHFWTPLINDELTCIHEDGNKYNEFAVAVLKEGLVVGHVPRQISKQFCNLLKSGGFIKVKIIGTPANTKRVGIRVPCMYTACGQNSFIQDIKNTFVCIL